MNKKVKADFSEGLPVMLDDTSYNIDRNINGEFGEVRYANDTLGVLVKLNNGEWAYYFAKDIQCGIVG